VGAENDHILGHEIAHLFQFDLTEQVPDAAGMARLPLWFVEGMAEYVSLGSDDPNTAMWLRAALADDALPTVDQLTTDPRLFPYRYGHAFWAYAGGRWGDEAVAALFRAALRLGVRGGIERALGVPVEEFEADWHARITEAYGALLQDREPAAALGTPLMPGTARGTLALTPQLSPDGQWLTYIGQDALGRVDLRLRDMATGRDVRSLGAVARDGHTDAIAFLYASGAWSPDGRQFAQVVVRRGDSELALISVPDGTLRDRLRIPGVQAISAVAWSPDGRQLAIAGSRDGQGDLFLYDLAERQVQQLTNDPYTELHPAWAPNGRYIAVATDRHEETDLERLAYGRLRLALVDPVGGRVRAVPDLGDRARMINPQWSADSRALYFVGEVDGVADVFRVDLARGVFDQLTRVQTGISGITARSPALTVAPGSNTVVVTVFGHDGYQLVALDRSRVEGYQRLADDEVPVTVPIAQGMGGVLPPITASPSPLVDAMLVDGEGGLPGPTAGAPFITRYRPRLGLEGIGVPAAGVSAGTSGAAVGGGLSLLWGDLLAKRRLALAVQAQGQVQDVGGQLLYLNAVSRWTLFGSLGHTPVASAVSSAGVVRIGDGGGLPREAGLLETGVARTVVQEAVAGAQYPFSRTRRVEVAVTGTRITQSVDLTQRLVDPGTGRVLDSRRVRGRAAPPLQYARWSLALVGDDAVFGATAPLAGWRYRLELSQTAGPTAHVELLTDGRWYRPLWRGAVAVRGMHVGRYGAEAAQGLLAPLFVGTGTLVRGYTAESIAWQECARSASLERCLAFDRLVGSRLVVANAEYRLPLDRLGMGPLPLEVAPFLDAGLAWQGGDGVALAPGALSRQGDAVRRPVLSRGVSVRVNLGVLILEAFHARPLQRGGGGMFGVNLAPGW
jgi:Tol biopolymer transport system component